MWLMQRLAPLVFWLAAGVTGCKTHFDPSAPYRAAPSSPTTSPHLPSDLATSAIAVAERYQQMFSQAGETAIATKLQVELSKLKSQSDSNLVPPDFGVGFFPKISAKQNNPYLNALYAYAETVLAQTDSCYPLSTKTNSIFPKDRYQDARNVGHDLEQLYFLLISPESPYRFHPRLTERFFCRLYATAYDYFLHGGHGLNIPGSTPNALDDWFATGPVIYSWSMAQQTMAALIPETFKNFMNAAAERAGNAILAIPTTPRYANRDISYAEILLQAGQLLRHQPFLDEADKLLAQTCSSLYPDGAFPYIWNQNECVNYHAGNLRSIARIYAMTGKVYAKDCLIKAKNFEVLTVEPGTVSEFYTSPAWKTMWNGAHGVDGAEPVASLSANATLRSMIDQQIAATGAAASALYAAFYRTDFGSRKQPDRYIVFDRNILGPRGRFGEFSYAMTGRDVTAENTNDPGHLTLVGSMLTEGADAAAGAGGLHAALMAVYPKVHVLAGNDDQEWNRWAYLRSQVRASSVILNGVAAFNASSRLQTQSTGPSASEYPWDSTETWIALDDRIIGLIITTAADQAKAFQLNGRIKFGYGRSGTRKPQELTTITAGKAYRYGNFQIRLHQHSYKSVTTAKAGVLRDAQPLDAREIILSDRSGPGDLSERPYDVGTSAYFIVEIAKADAVALDNVTYKRQGELSTLFIQKQDRAYQVSVNHGSTETNIAFDRRLPRETTKVWGVLRPGEKPRAFPANQAAIPAGALLFAVATPDSSEQALGWQSLDAILAQ